MAPLVEVVAAGAEELELELLLEELEDPEDPPELEVDPVEEVAGEVAVEVGTVEEDSDPVEEDAGVVRDSVAVSVEDAEVSETEPVGEPPATRVGVETPSAAQAWATTVYRISIRERSK